MRRPKKKLEPLPLSTNENHLFKLIQDNPNNSAYYLPIALQLNGSICLDVLKKALQLMIKRHDILHSGYFQNANQPSIFYKQIVDDYCWEPTMLNWQDLDAVEFEIKFKTQAKLLAETQFDYQHPPLMRICLIQKKENEWILLMVISHLIADGWSIKLFLMEVLNGYHDLLSDRPCALFKVAPYQYQYFVNNEMKLLKSTEFVMMQKCWQSQCKKQPTVMLNYDGDSTQNLNTIDAVSFSITVETLEYLKMLCQSYSTTLYIIFLSIWQKVLSDHFKLQSLPLKLLFANRSKREFRTLIGYLANGVFFNNHLISKQPFLDLVKRTSEIVKSLEKYQAFPFAEWFTLAQFENKSNCKFVFNWHNYLSTTKQLEGLMIRRLPFPISINNMWNDGTELSCNFYPDKTNIFGIIRYRSCLFSKQTIEMLVNNYLQYIQNLKSLITKI